MVLCPACASAFAVGSTSQKDEQGSESKGGSKSEGKRLWKGLKSAVKGAFKAPEGSMSIEELERELHVRPADLDGMSVQYFKLRNAINANQGTGKWGEAARNMAIERVMSLKMKLDNAVAKVGVVEGSPVWNARRRSTIIDGARDALASVYEMPQQ
eukprot:2508146-Rhodomonas_salina.1